MLRRLLWLEWTLGGAALHALAAAPEAAPMKIYTRTGDRGETGLFGGQRVPKDDARVEAYGDVDELNAVLGLAAVRARGGGRGGASRSGSASVQADLFTLGANLATPAPEDGGRAQRPPPRRSPPSASRRWRAGSTRPTRSWRRCAPSSSPAGARPPRACTWRAPSAAAPSGGSSPSPATTRVDAEVVRYLNRLSDLLFTLARAGEPPGGRGGRGLAAPSR